MVGAGETFLPAFALAIGFSQVASGMLSSAPLLLGSVLQLFSPWILSRVGSYRKWVTFLGAVQALAFLPLIGGALKNELSGFTIFSALTLYWTCSQAGGPAWNTWMSQICPAALRAKYFGKRNRYGQIGVAIGLVGAGFFLQWMKPRGFELKAFAVLFAIAAIFRLISAYCLFRKSDLYSVPGKEDLRSWASSIKRLAHKADGRLILFFALFQTTVQISGPFVNPYLIKQLQLSYGHYMMVIGAAFISKILIFPVLGPWAKRVGPFRLMQIGGLGAIFTPMFWLFSDNYTWLVLSQALNGAIWAVFDLGFSLAVFEKIDDRDRTRMMSIHNLTNAIAVITGASIGGFILESLGQTHQAYIVLFAVSTTSRMVSVFALERIVLKVGTQHLKPAYVIQSSLAILKKPAKEERHKSAS
jgi:MFS family permease